MTQTRYLLWTALLTSLITAPLLSQTIEIHQPFTRALYFDQNGLSGMETPVLTASDAANTFAWGSKNLQYYGGKFYFVYKGYVNEEHNIYIQTSEDGLTWSDQIEVSDGPPGTEQRDPKMVIGGDLSSPEICVAWYDTRATNVQVHAAVSTDGGLTWGSSQVISDHTNSVRAVIDMARDGDGNYYLAWNRRNSSGQYTKTWFSRSTDGGQTWTAKMEIHSGNEFSFPTQIVATGTGEVMIGICEAEWVSGWTNNLVVYVSSDSGTTWQPRTRPTAYTNINTGAFRFFVMAKSPDGDVHFIHTMTVAGIPERYWHTKTANWAQNWAPLVTISDTTYSELHSSDTQIAMPAIAFSPQGNIYAAWTDERQDVQSDNYEIYLTRSTDGGQTWSQEIIVNDSMQISSQLYPALAVSSDGITDKVVVGYIEKHAVPVGIELVQNGSLPTSYDLSQNYPNPFNPSTTINFQLPNSARVNLSVFNIRGQQIKTLANQELASGNYSVTWDGRDNSGHLVSSGVYIYRLTAGEFIKTRKMILLH